MKKPNYSPQTDWVSKEKRELFCKAVNSMLMTTPEAETHNVMEIAKLIVDTAFTNYPDRVEEEAKKQDFELNIVED